LGYSNAEIGRQLERDRSTIGREIKRNSIDGKCSPFKAQLACQERKQNCGAKNILKESILLIDIQDKLENSWTPEQIAGADHKGAIMTYVCRKTRFLIAN